MQENAEYILTSLPGTVTFAPGDVGFSIFGALHPMEDEKHIAGFVHATTIFCCFTKYVVLYLFSFSHSCFS